MMSTRKRAFLWLIPVLFILVFFAGMAVRTSRQREKDKPDPAAESVSVETDGAAETLPIETGSAVSEEDCEEVRRSFEEYLTKVKDTEEYRRYQEMLKTVYGVEDIRMNVESIVPADTCGFSYHAVLKMELSGMPGEASPLAGVSAQEWAESIDSQLEIGDLSQGLLGLHNFSYEKEYFFGNGADDPLYHLTEKYTIKFYNDFSLAVVSAPVSEVEEDGMKALLSNLRCEQHILEGTVTITGRPFGEYLASHQTKDEYGNDVLSDESSDRLKEMYGLTLIIDGKEEAPRISGSGYLYADEAPEECEFRLYFEKNFPELPAGEIRIRVNGFESTFAVTVSDEEIQKASCSHGQ